MTPPSYTIEPDAAGEYLHIVMSGHWNEAITAQFSADVAKVLERMLRSGTRHGHLRTLIDMRHKNVVPQSVASEFARMVHPGSPSKRIALVFSGAVHRLQAKRIADDRCRTFDDLDDARSWLFED